MSDVKYSQHAHATGSAKMTIGSMNQSVGAGSSLPATEPEPTGTVFLFVAANPEEDGRLHLDREMREIDAALRMAGSKRTFQVEQAWAAQERDLQEALLRHRPEIVHLSGHGFGSGDFLFADSRTVELPHLGFPDDAPPGSAARLDALAGLFAAARGKVRCVVVNACHSARLAEVLSQHIDVAIGMQGEVDDEAALSFSGSFYTSLAYGVDVERAFQIAKAQFARQGGERGAPRLFASRVQPSRVTFGTEE